MIMERITGMSMCPNMRMTNRPNVSTSTRLITWGSEKYRWNQS